MEVFCKAVMLLVFVFMIQLWHVGGVTDKQFRKLENRLTILEHRDTWQQRTIIAQQEIIRQQSSDMIEIRHTMQEQSADIQILTNKINAQSRLIKRLLKNKKVPLLEKNTRLLTQSTTWVPTEKKLQSKARPTSSILHKEAKEMASIIHPFQKLSAPSENQKRLVVSNGEGPVAFMTSLSKTSVHLGLNQNIPFENILLNMGNGYHAQHGLFIVPVGGLYLFSTSLMLDNLTQLYGHAAIVLNGKVIARIDFDGRGGGWAQASQTVIIQANQGDEIWVRNIDLIDTQVSGQDYSTFTGYLLFQM